MRLFVLRHGESANVVAGAAGALPGSPLTPTGRDQARAAAAALGTEGISRIYSSTARRARQTARIIADELAIGAVALPGLVEVGIGSREGATDPGTRARTAAVLRAWVVDRDLDARVADGETGHEVVARISAALDRIVAEHAEHAGRPVAVVGHVASLTVGLTVLCGLDGGVWGAPLPHAEPFPVERDRGGWRCKDWPCRN